MDALGRTALAIRSFIPSTSVSQLEEKVYSQPQVYVNNQKADLYYTCSYLDITSRVHGRCLMPPLREIYSLNMEAVVNACRLRTPDDSLDILLFGTYTLDPLNMKYKDGICVQPCTLSD
jgi:hypothetical protein